MMRRALAAFALACLCGMPGAATAASADSDPKAVAIAALAVHALGGETAWKKLPGLRWTFGAASGDSLRFPRRHAWNRRTGEHRLEGTTRSGVRFVFIHTLGDTTHGFALMNDARIEGDSLRKLIGTAESLWKNDSDWLLIPYRLADPAAQLRYDGETTVDTVAFDRIAVSYPPPKGRGDRYWLYVNRTTHRVERCEYVLAGNTPPPQDWTVEGYTQSGGLWFATTHRRRGSTIMTTNVEAVDAFAEAEFRAP